MGTTGTTGGTGRKLLAAPIFWGNTKDAMVGSSAAAEG
jgi:hypothetical protein